VEGDWISTRTVMTANNLDSIALFLIFLTTLYFLFTLYLQIAHTLMDYDNNKEVCDVIETKLNSVQMELSNRFKDLTEKVNNLVAYIEQEPETTMVIEDAQPSEQVINRKQVTVESIASMTAAILSEEMEQEKRKLNLID